MQLSPREKMRHDVRAIVHRACWQRFEGDAAGADSFLEGEMIRLVETAGESAPEDDTLRAWIEEDRDDFNRGMLIGDLVARRLATSQAAASADVSRAVVARGVPDAAGGAAAAAATRTRRADVPGIADLLDDMLEQDRRSRPRG